MAAKKRAAPQQVRPYLGSIDPKELSVAYRVAHEIVRLACRPVALGRSHHGSRPQRVRPGAGTHLVPRLAGLP